MTSFGENGWIKYGWSENLNPERTNGDNFYIKFIYDIESLSNQPVITTAIECIKKISETYPPPYNLMCSGGTDSQSMIYLWLKSKVPFNIISVKYISNNIYWNKHDLSTLEQFALVNNLTINFKEFDIINFLENDLNYISKTYNCPSPHISTHIKMTDLVPMGTIIFSGNFIHNKRALALSPALLGLHKFSLTQKRKEISIIPFFFLEYPELAHAFKNFDLVTKNIAYIESGIPIIPQPDKITGFEEVKNYYDKYTNRVTKIERLKFSNKPSKRIFDLLFRYPYEGIKNYKVIQLLSKE